MSNRIVRTAYTHKDVRRLQVRAEARFERRISRCAIRTSLQEG